MTLSPPPPIPAPGKGLSLVLTVLMHLMLAAFLIYGVRWQTKVHDVVEVDLVRALPTPAPAARPEPPPPPKPEPRPEPKPQPKPEPVKPAPPPPKPDIALKEKPKPPPKEEPKPPKFDPFKQQMLEEEKRLAMHKQVADEERRLQQQQQARAAAARDKALASYSDKIRAKIRGNIVLPPDLKGNPKAEFDVVQLPSGEVISARLVKGSGHAGYDAAVERAILKSSPLPRPDDPSLFERSLRLTFCPLEDGKCG
jgi:colicin import membrane protein